MSRMWIAGIVLLAFVLRVAGLSVLPAGFTPDEASFGYDAYSLLKTGRDQWGNTFPTTFKSFGDYKLPVYTYITVPSVAIFGLNRFAVRLPNAILGTLAVLFTYFLSAELIDQKKGVWRAAPLLSALFLSVSYWHIALSRGAFEANLTTFFMGAGVFFFLKARHNTKWLWISMLFFGINLFTYHAARIITPVIVVALLWIYRASFSKKKQYGLASGVFLFFFVGSILSLFAGSGVRAATSTVISQNLGSGSFRASIVNAGMPITVAHMFYNEPLFKAAKIVQNYLSYLSSGFFYTEGAREANYGMVPRMGVLSIVEFLGLPLFLLLFLKGKDQSSIFLLIWILVSPLPAAISVGPGNAANRAAIMMPALEICAAYGVLYFVSLLKNRIQKPAVVGISFLILLVGFISFSRYAYEQPIYASGGMMYGMDQLFDFLKEYPTKHVLLSRSLSEPQIYAAFYDPIYPNLFQKATTNWNYQSKGLFWVDQQEGYFVGRYVIGSIDKVRDFYLEDTLVVGTPDEMSDKARILKTIYTPDRKPLWVIGEKQ